MFKLKYLLPLLFSFNLIFLAPLHLHAAPSSHPQEQQVSKEVPVKARLIAEEQGVSGGRPFLVGVELQMAEGWDTYWVNPGDSGFPTQVKWDLPAGFTASPLKWPYPQKITNDQLVAFGYTGKALLLAEITPPKQLTGESVQIKAAVNWLACKDACVPGDAQLALSLPVQGEPQKNLENASIFEQAKNAVPKALKKEEGKVTFQPNAGKWVLNFQIFENAFGEIEDLLFIPEQGEVVDYAAPQNLSKAKQGVSLDIKLAHPENQAAQVKGVLLVSEKGNPVKKAIQIEAPLASKSSASTGKLSMTMGLAFLGGLILNVMPCVLPVIALKIFSFVKIAQERRRVIFEQGALFSLGVVVSFWVLSGILLILRAYGEGIGWGFQLQEPLFVVSLILVLFLLSLSLFGVFEFGTSLMSMGQKTSSKISSPHASSFMSGVLATAVATPCTGPLMGPALGFAMTLPPFQSLLIFTAMGLGMAFPYLLFSLFPSLIRFLPKPGNWMVAFKQLMGFVMMATVVWLLWVFSAQTDQMALFVLIGALLLVSLGMWIFGRWATPVQGKKTRRIATAVTALLLLFSGYGAIKVAKQSKHDTVSTALEIKEGGWQAYSPEKVEQLRAAGTPVFVDFTAKWCLICQANKVILHSSEIEKAFHERGVVTMQADWTKKDASITAELEKLGRSGVPVYALYPGNTQEAPHILPQNLSSRVVQEFLGKLEGTTVYNK